MVVWNELSGYGHALQASENILDVLLSGMTSGFYEESSLSGLLSVFSRLNIEER